MLWGAAPILLSLVGGCATPEQRAFVAINDGKTEELTALVAGGLNVHARDKLGFTLLHWSVILGNDRAVECLLSHGAAINEPLAPEFKGFEEVNLHTRGLTYKCPKRGEEWSKIPGWSPLLLAAAGGHIRVFKLLKQRGAAPDPCGFGLTPLHAAAGGCFGIHGDDGEKRRAMIAYLLEDGYDINAKTTSGRTPLDFALRWGKKNTARFLRARGAR